MFTEEEKEIIYCGLERIARESEDLEKQAEGLKQESQKILDLINKIYEKVEDLEEI